MNYINIQNGVQLRDRGGKGEGKGHLHAVIGFLPNGVIVMQSKNHKQTIQSAIHPNGKLVVTYFAEIPDQEPKELAEEIINLWRDKEGRQKWPT